MIERKILDSVPAETRRYRYSRAAFDVYVNDESKVGRYSDPYRTDVEK